MNPDALEKQEIKFDNDIFIKYRNMFERDGSNLKLTPSEDEEEGRNNLYISIKK